MTKTIFLKYMLPAILILMALTGIAACGDGDVPPAVETPSTTTSTNVEAKQAGQVAVADSPFGFHPARVGRPGYPDNGFADAQNIGVAWAREGVYAFWFKIQPDLGSPQYDFSIYDSQWGQVPPGMQILANIAPETDLRDEGRLQSGTWVPVDESKYRAFVTATVERYDGDGVSDMPDLRNPIRYWQVGNEPDNTRRSGFAALQRISYEAIKQACAECQVVIGGVSGMPGDYIKNFDEDFAPILAELGGKYVDVFDFHWYGAATGDYRLKDGKTGADVLDHIRATLKADGFPETLPIWVAEMGAYSGDPARVPGRTVSDDPPQTERQQAGDYFKRFIYPISRGVGKIFPAFGIIEGFKNEGGYFDHTGLIYDGKGSGDLGLGVRKLGYYTYKKMTESLGGADFSTLTQLRDGTGGDHLYLFRVMKNGEPVYIAWWDYFDEPGYAPGATRSIDISDLQAGRVRVTDVVPAAESGQAVTDYKAAFTSITAPVADGVATVQLGEDPVIITVEPDSP